MTDEERFLNFIEVDPITGCWLWTGSRNKAGYGRFSVGGTTVYAHRWSYGHFVGPIPPGANILHGCDTPPCANWNHVNPGTQRQNMAHLRVTFCRKHRVPCKPLPTRPYYCTLCNTELKRKQLAKARS